MRLSQENENRQGTSNYQPSQTGRAKETVSLKLYRSRRLRTREEFRRIKKQGKRITGRVVVFDVLSEKFPYPRLGLTVSKKFGNAVMRNRFKRLAREAFRLKQHELSPGCTIHITPLKEMPTLQQILEDLSLIHAQ